MNQDDLQEYDIYGELSGQSPPEPQAQAQPQQQQQPLQRQASEPEQTPQHQSPAPQQALSEQGSDQQGQQSSAPQGSPAPSVGTADGPRSVYVGQLQWWTTDAELEAACSEYGHVEEVKIYEERGNGKSKGYALVRFTDSSAAQACKEGLNGRLLNDKKCVVTLQTGQHRAAGPTAGRGFGRGAYMGRGSMHMQGVGQGFGMQAGRGPPAVRPQLPERGLGRMGALGSLPAANPMLSQGMQYMPYAGAVPQAYQQAWMMGSGAQGQADAQSYKRQRY